MASAVYETEIEHVIARTLSHRSPDGKLIQIVFSNRYQSSSVSCQIAIEALLSRGLETYKIGNTIASDGIIFENISMMALYLSHFVSSLVWLWLLLMTTKGRHKSYL